MKTVAEMKARLRAIAVEADEIENLIESAVLQLKQMKK